MIKSRLPAVSYTHLNDGKIILHEDTDVLLSDYALLKVDAKQYDKLDKQFILRSRKEAYGYSCLTNQKQYYMAVSYTHLSFLVPSFFSSSISQASVTLHSCV